jgi:hypothetical protein
VGRTGSSLSEAAEVVDIEPPVVVEHQDFDAWAGLQLAVGERRKIASLSSVASGYEDQ